MAEESDIVFARRNFIEVQAALDVYPSKMIDGVFTCGWYGTAINAERGSFCVVNEDGPLADRVGEYIRVSYLNGSVSVYCLESLTIPYDLALARRAYYDLSPLWTSFLNVRVADLQDNDAEA